MVDDGLQHWIGTTEAVDDRITPAPARALAATLDRDIVPDSPGDALPPLWHWAYFLATPATHSLGPDGHAERGGFLPPVDLPRRMWAGSRLWFHQPLRLGEGVQRTSRISDITEKQGRSGKLVIVTVTHAYHGEGGLAIIEEQDIVYREATPPSAGGDKAELAPPGEPEWSRTVTPDPILLFRYSALTFNSHRIHYDQPYATEVEGYPGLVVHGPLTLTLLVEALTAAHPQRTIVSLSMRALQPLFHGVPFHAQGRLADNGHQAELWSVDHRGGVTMQASAELAD